MSVTLTIAICSHTGYNRICRNNNHFLSPFVFSCYHFNFVGNCNQIKNVVQNCNFDRNLILFFACKSAMVLLEGMLTDVYFEVKRRCAEFRFEL